MPKKNDKSVKPEETKTPNMEANNTPKKIRFAEQRKVILNTIFTTLGLVGENKIFFIDELDADAEKTKKIIDLAPDIKQYFSCSGWAYFSYKAEVKKTTISLIRSIFKDMNVKYSSVYVMDDKNKNVNKRGLLVTKPI